MSNVPTPPSKKDYSNAEGILDEPAYEKAFKEYEEAKSNYDKKVQYLNLRSEALEAEQQIISLDVPNPPNKIDYMDKFGNVNEVDYQKALKEYEMDKKVYDIKIKILDNKLSEINRKLQMLDAINKAIENGFRVFSETQTTAEEIKEEREEFIGKIDEIKTTIQENIEKALRVFSDTNTNESVIN